jgi:uncharacterized protein
MVARLIVFLKAPLPGTVKTRLAAEVGDEKACAIYCELVETLLANLAPVYDLELRISPNDGDISQWARAGWAVRGQGTGTLTNRLILAFAEAFAQGADRVVIIGSDCPEVAVADIEAAWTALKTHDVVLGPAADGGYWLVGLCRPLPEIFTGIPWSSSQVLEKTMAIARQLGCKTHLLRTLNDVDTFADWQRFQRLRLNGGLSDSGAAEPR